MLRLDKADVTSSELSDLMLEVQHIPSQLLLPPGSSKPVSQHANDNGARPCVGADNRAGTREANRHLRIC